MGPNLSQSRTANLAAEPRQTRALPSLNFPCYIATFLCPIVSNPLCQPLFPSSRTAWRLLIAVTPLQRCLAGQRPYIDCTAEGQTALQLD